MRSPPFTCVMMIGWSRDSSVTCVLLLAAVGAASCSAVEGSPAFAAAPLISRLRGGGMPQFWANQQDLKNAPERWSGGFAKLRAMCGGALEEEKACRGKASRLAGACGGLFRARVQEDDTRWCMRMHARRCMRSPIADRRSQIANRARMCARPEMLSLTAATLQASGPRSIQLGRKRPCSWYVRIRAHNA